MFDIFQYPSDDSLLLVGVYDPHLVVISVLLAVFASIMALHIVGQMQRSTQASTRLLILVAGSLAFGGGVWAMHFVGMLAFELCAYVNYDPWLTLYSLVPAFFAALVALYLLSQDRVAWLQILGGGSLMGVGIGAMHYAGMSAMEMGPLLRYDPGFFVLSLVAAIALSCLSLWVRAWMLKRYPAGELKVVLLSGSLLGLAISVMHYLGMAAARFVGFPELDGDRVTLNVEFLALTVAAVVVIFTLGVFIAGGFLSYTSVMRRLANEEEKFRSLVGNIPGIAYRCLPDEHWTMLYISDAVETIAGYPAKDFLTGGGRYFSDFIHPDDRERVARSVLNASHTFEVEYRAVHRDGSVRHVWENGCLVRDDLGEIQWLDGVILDISQRYEMEQALRHEKARAEEAAAAKTAFLANVSHEIRTPMNAITGFTEVLLQSDLSLDQRQHLDTIRVATSSLLHLLNDILDAAKLERGLVELMAINFSLPETLQQVVATLRPGAQKKELALKLEYDPELGEFYRGDEPRLRQVLLNILGNAIKFTLAGEVSVKATREDGQVCIRIRDTGIGIPRDRLSAIFDPFTQGDATMTRQFGGTGLGTTISKQLVELMGGSILVDSREGEGSEFTIKIPLPPGEVAELPTNPERLQLPPLSILVVDDVPPNVQLLEILLRKAGHEVTSAHNGLEALELFKYQSFDLILMDVQMPVMDGLEASRCIRLYEQERQLKPTPIIALTASALEEDRLAALQAGMDGFATKPINLRLLQREMADLLGLTLEATGTELEEDNQGQPILMAVNAGLGVWQDVHVYAQALERFISEQMYLPTKLDELILAGDESGYREMLHRVKGASLNLALLALGEKLGELLLHAPSDSQTWRRQRQELAQLLVDTRSAIHQWSEAQPLQANVQAGSLSEAEQRSALERLRQALLGHRLDEQALLQVTTAAGVSPGLIKSLRQALAEFEFDKALKLLQQVEQQLFSTGER